MGTLVRIVIAVVILVVGVLASAAAKELVGFPNALGILITLGAAYLYWSKSSVSKLGE